MALVGAILAGCARGDPPTWDAAGASLSAVALAMPSPTPPAHDTHEARASSAAPAASATLVADAGPGIDAGALPQTHDQPEASGTAFDARVQALWNAIVHDDPERGMPFFFPVAAYEQVKDIGNPAADWRRRLVAAYTHDIHALHAKLGAQATDARLVTFDLPKERARWVRPGEEYNKLGYYRVFGTKLRYESSGRRGTFDVTSLISWRGEWYVVHLGAIK